MIVVSDTSAITSLIQIGMADLLRQVFEDVFIPPAVRDELKRFHQDLPGFLQVRPPVDSAVVDQLMSDLGRGEAEAIVLACEIRADFLLIDEKRGRDIARSRGIRVIGLLGALLRAKEERLVISLAEVMRLLEDKAGFHVGEEVKETVLRAAGEA